MFIELVDSLRCIRPHELTWLVASATRMDARDIVLGELGCHVCGAEYPIVDGIADFTLDPAVSHSPPTEGATTGFTGEELAMRAAALLDLAEPGGFAVLAGSWGACAPLLTQLTPRIHLFVLDAPPGIESGDGISLARVRETIPIRPGACRGIALDAAHTAPPLVAAAVNALRPQGRLVAPASLPIPAGVTELVRDERHWVGARDVQAPIVQLVRK